MILPMEIQTAVTDATLFRCVEVGDVVVRSIDGCVLHLIVVHRSVDTTTGLSDLLR